ncbi:MAG: hypothetical protein B6U76_01855, partial [Desulfurococcales archaeon ex4484_217_2]
MYKPLIRLKNKPLIKIVIENLEELFNEIIVVVKNEEQRSLLEHVLRNKDVVFTLDTSMFRDGPLVAMYTGAMKAR